MGEPAPHRSVVRCRAANREDSKGAHERGRSASGRDGALSKAVAAGRAPAPRAAAEVAYRCAVVILNAGKTMAYGMLDGSPLPTVRWCAVAQLTDGRMIGAWGAEAVRPVVCPHPHERVARTASAWSR